MIVWNDISLLAGFYIDRRLLLLQYYDDIFYGTSPYLHEKMK